MRRSSRTDRGQKQGASYSPGLQNNSQKNIRSSHLRPLITEANPHMERPPGEPKTPNHTARRLWRRKMKQAMDQQRDSRMIAARVAMDQLDAMGAAGFDIGVKRFDGTMLLREGWGAKQVLKSLLWLRRENLNRGHIYVRPAGVHGLSLVDDLKADALARMKAEGFEPAAVVETSPGNLQVWLKHGETLDEAASTRAAKLLAQRYGGDPGSADWRHFGRLAGFTNPKPNRRLASGLQPFARLLEATGIVRRRYSSRKSKP